MTTVVIGNEVPDSKIQEIRDHLDDVAMRDVNWNGTIFKIERGDYTYITNDESAEAIILLQVIREIIFGNPDIDE